MRILFVRHGRSIANATGMVGTPETLLAEDGMEQARVTGQDLLRENVTRVICSPFIRAQQTAEIIAGELGIPLHDISINANLYERRMGELEGKLKRHETEFFYTNDTDLGFESQRDLLDRLSTALEEVKAIAEKTDGTTVVVGHATGFYLLQIAKGNKRLEDFDPISNMNNAEFLEVPISEKV